METPISSPCLMVKLLTAGLPPIQRDGSSRITPCTVQETPEDGSTIINNRREPSAGSLTSDSKQSWGQPTIPPFSSGVPPTQFVMLSALSNFNHPLSMVGITAQERITAEMANSRPWHTRPFPSLVGHNARSTPTRRAEWRRWPAVHLL